ncbi:hypothetical protein GE061_013499 [Apolygus lucorum]|uniref:Lysosomal-trafficking regulator n=1 Tax=Apolygus lucorum TaxID=248454 RepID=A0A6A4KCA7_APOLU|nr:hypothetical protein GE061_013499 [Apolygus lucorum]
MGDKSAVNPSSTKIHLFWDSFLKAESKSFERGSWFDIFLAEALLQLHDGKSNSDILSLTSANVGNVTAAELVSDIKAICDTQQDEDDFDALRRHMFNGRGWKAIALLYNLGVNDVTCAAELCKLLTSVYGIEDDGNDQNQHNQYVVEKPVLNIEQACKFRLPSKIKSRTFSMSSGIEGSPGPSRKVSSSSYSKRMQKQEREKVKNLSDSEGQDNEPVVKSHSSPLKIWLNPMDFDYFTTCVRSDDEKPKKAVPIQAGSFKRKAKKLAPDDFADEKIQGLFQTSMCSNQLRVLIVDILQGLCQLETLGSSVLVNCFNFSLEQLCSLQFSVISPSSKHLEQLKQGMTRLFLSALDRILVLTDATHAIICKGALPIMLRLLEDGITKTQSNKKPPVSLQDFIFGVSYAIINLIHSLLLQNNHQDKLASFFPNLQQFLNCSGGRIIDKTVLSIMKFRNVNEKETLNRARKIVGLLSQLISSFKQMRTKFVHMRQCKKPKHKHCKYSLVSHHHDDVFGTIYSNTLLSSNEEGSCAITTLFMVFTRLLSDQAEREVIVRTMQAMMNCGTCCCFPASSLISRILKVIQQSDTKVKNLGLVLLEKTIYREVGAMDHESMCQVCVNVGEKDKTFTDLTKHRWACLEAFQDMLLSPNQRVAYTIGSHLMRVTPRCGIQVQREMFFGVFFPVFLTSKKKYEKNKLEKDKWTLNMCLAAFTHLLGRTRFADEFLERDGMKHVFDLIGDKSLTPNCCLVIEIIVIVRIWKLEGVKHLGEVALDEEIEELKVLQNCVVSYSTEFLSLLKKLSTKKNEDKVLFSSEAEWENYNKSLEKLGQFWKSWMNLCLYCPQIRTYSTRHLSMQCYTLLTLFLQHLSKVVKFKDTSKGDVNERLIASSHLNLKLLESLIVLSVITPYTGNPGGIAGLKKKLLAIVEGHLGLRSICDVLIRCSSANPSMRTMIPVHQMPKIDMLEIGVLAQSEDHNSDSSFESADEGYDADIDLPCRKPQERDDNRGQGSLPPSRKVSSMFGDRKCNNLSHPSLLLLALDLITSCHKNGKWGKECVYSLNKLISALRDVPENAVLLSKNGFTLELLTQFSELLSEDDPKNYEMLQAVLELFSHLAKYSVKSQELGIFISFFIRKNPPIKMLLPSLVKVLANTLHQPKYTIKFPAPYSNGNLVNLTAAHKLGISLHQLHISTDLESCWSRSALFLPLNPELGWAMWVQGFSFSMWLRLDPPCSNDDPNEDSAESINSDNGPGSGLDEINVNNLLHVISIGYEALVLEFWADASRELIHVRLTRPDGEKIEVLSDVSLEGRLSSQQWHHLAISVHDSVHSGRVIIEVTLIIDGWCEVQVPLAFKGLLVRKSRPTNVLLGDTKRVNQNGEPIGSWELGGLLMFRKPVLDKKFAIWLTALGPDCYTLTKSRVGDVKPAWHSVFNPKTLTAGIPWDEILDTKKVNLKELQETLLLSYTAKRPDILNIYPIASAALSSLGGGFRVTNVEQRSSQLVPMCVQLVMYCQATPDHYSSFTTAVDSLGGPEVFLFLFARVVDMGGSAIEQAQALELFLRLVHLEPLLAQDAAPLIPLVRHVIETKECLPGPHMLKGILEACCDKPGLITCWADELQVTSQGGDFLLTEPFLITHLVLGPAQAWLDTLPMFLQALLVLLRDDHPHREFNATQLNRAKALDSLLYFCKKRLERIVEDQAKLESELSSSLVNVIRGLMTAPPELEHVTKITDYLLLAHPVHATYISHSRSSMYFVLPPKPPSKNKRSRKKLGLFDRGDSHEYALFTHPKAVPLDPSKLAKALANLQIKQNGRRLRMHSSESSQYEVVCDSGIAGSYRGNATDSEPLAEQDDEELSNTSANTYFLACANQETEDNSARDDSSNETDDDEKFSSDPVGYIEEGDDNVTVGLLEVLRDQILVMPDNVAHNALPNVLTPESFIVMANHSNTKITTAVVKVLSAYLERANAEEKNRFVKDKGFYLLAMQLNHTMPSTELADALAGIVTNTHWLPISTQFEAEPSEFNLPGIPPLLSLLPKSVSDIALTHNIIVFVQNIFKVGDWRKLLEYGLVESLLKALVCLIHQKKYVISDLCIPESNVIVCDINNFLSLIAIHAIQTSGSGNIQIYNELIMLVEYVCCLENKSCGSIAQCSLAVKQSHCAILQASLKALSDAIASHPVKAPFLSSVISLSSDEVDSSHSLSSLHTLTIGGKLSKSELNERFKTVVTRATEFVIYSEPVTEQQANSFEEVRRVDEFVREVWMFILQALVTVIERRSMSSRTSWSNVVWANKEVIRNLGSQLFLWLLSPAHSRNLKLFTVQSVLNEPRCKDILMYILHNTHLEKTLALFLWDIRYQSGISESDARVCEELTLKMEEWCSSPILGLVNGSNEITVPTVLEACMEASLSRNEWHHQHMSQILKVVHKHEPLVADITERAESVTREVVANQSFQRKQFLENFKSDLVSKVQAVFKWKEIVNSLTHERAVWHFPESYPRSWELDPTEGPARVRNRLRRCQLNLDNKYFRPERRQSGDPPEPPLNFIFDGSMSTSAVLIDRLHSNSKIRHMCKASVISPDSALPGELLIGHCCLYFVPSTGMAMEWGFDQIKELHRRRFELQERALEIFLMNGETFLVAFESLKDRDNFMSALLDCELHNRVASEPLGDAVDLWREGHITNWHYLSILNTHSGRSYNDLMQYPVLPFILADYTSSVLDLTDAKSFRNLMRPMAIQEKKNESHYISNYNYLKTELTDALNVMSHNHEPYHYSSHYSNSGIVLHFLVRLPPFTKMFLSYQDNNFDWPDRTFHSLHTTWRLTSSESTTDVKELIPEFFFLPEFLFNAEGFNFGVRQNGEVVDNVGLPPWAPDARLFILIHRQALESEHVREFLPHWIDLVYGYKQTGKAAIDCINVFHPATYYGFDPDSILDPVLRTAGQTMVRMYGQTPKQLFRAAHPMVVKSLAPTSVPPQVLPSVKGLQWGHYVGSPGDTAPLQISLHSHHTPITSLVALLSNDVFGLAQNSTLLLTYSKETPLSASVAGTTSVLDAALISWNHGDGVIRAKLRKDQVPFPAITCGVDSVALCASVPDCNQLWVAYVTGKIHVYTYKFDGVGGSLDLELMPTCLVGHRSSVTSIAISRAFSIAVSVSEDGSAIMWDINRLEYVRSLPLIAMPINLVSVSETLGDVATVGQDPGGSSNLRLHSINGMLVGSVSTREQITSLCFSSAPEGISVNVVACGMCDGYIRLWSTWDLTPVGVITANRSPAERLSQAIISLTYSQDSQHLYASTADGLVVIWQGSCVKPSAKTPRFLNLTSLS